MTLKAAIQEILESNGGRRYPKDRIVFLESRLLDINSNLLNDDFEVVFVLDEEEYANKLQSKLVESTNWRPTGKKDYWMRTDPPRQENGFHREICIAHKKNIGSTPQWTWKANMARRDLAKSTREPDRIVRQIAADFFGVDVNMLEMIIATFDKDSGMLLKEECVR